MDIALHETLCTNRLLNLHSINKHDTTQISNNELHSVLEAKLNFQSLLENSRTIDDLIKLIFWVEYDNSYIRLLT